jgi:hypothetical protein
MARNMTFLKNTSLQVATDFRQISLDLEPNPGSTLQYQQPKDPSTIISLYPRILAENIVSDPDCYQYLLNYPDEVIIFYHPIHLEVCWVVPTLYEINTNTPQSPSPAQQASGYPNTVVIDVTFQTSMRSLPSYLNILSY